MSQTLNQAGSAALAPSADWIDNAAQLGDWLAAVPAEAPLGIDTEFMRRNTFYPQLALLQLGAADRYALVDPTQFDAGPALSQALSRHLGPRIMHSPSEDFEALAPLLPRGLGHFFDTQLAAAMCGYGLGLSYRALVLQFCGMELDKGETRSDWLQRPLTASQQAYATLDVVYLEPIQQALQTRLESLGRTAWLEEDCQRMLHRAAQSGDEQPQREFRGAAEWSRENQALLRRILLWRDRTARELDTPRPWLFEDAMAMSMVSDRPQTDSELAAITRGRRALRGAQRRELMAQLQTPISAEDVDATASIPPAPQDAQKRAVAAMKREVDTLAQELDLPAGLLCPRKAIERIAITGEWPETFDGWRGPLLRERLAPLLP
ncbi:HRDC domain-containing protein [Oleiagrimonas sp. C23AA]|uniref:ribonuclease D n=1 Tax=Oleiagrimonas sp. C23AA TaxID=2719047 RepID=UPI001F0E445E|nr:HRDC domain-containing protein [Oleiagrimonas sp. C23AA]